MYAVQFRAQRAPFHIVFISVDSRMVQRAVALVACSRAMRVFWSDIGKLSVNFIYPNLGFFR